LNSREFAGKFFRKGPIGNSNPHVMDGLQRPMKHHPLKGRISFREAQQEEKFHGRVLLPCSYQNMPYKNGMMQSLRVRRYRFRGR
jgi:hypothetical protein